MRRFVFGLSIILSAAFIILFNLDVNAVQQTDTSATRTAIAITREPILGTPAAPSSIELTSTVEYKDYENRLAEIFNQPANEIDATSSAIVAFATQLVIDLTNPPKLSPTPYPKATDLPCKLYFYKTADDALTRQVKNELAGTRLQGDLTVYNFELSPPYNCSLETYHLRTDVEISLSIHNPEDDASIIAAIEELLSYLENSKLGGDARSLRLIIVFSHIDTSDNCKFRQIDTGYTNARLAYKEGLRGQNLIEALGGILETTRNLSVLCL
ncbi:MAG: hypothetical protein GC179_28570 [Anaerolineaceae bacterium]|nr:hypothetical protein [Anaerolineaceae bacterium]